MKQSGEVYGFGSNDYWQIGCNNNQNQTKPILINEFNSENVIAIYCGYYHSMALTVSQWVFSWGINDFNESWNYNKINRKIPIEVLIKDRIIVKRIICGPNHSLILTTNWEIHVSGDNKYGQIG